MNTSFKIGILAYGSLIDDPGKELKPLIVDRISCETPFKVEFARISTTRSNAPTLVPVTQGGRNVKAQILVLNGNIMLEQAKSMLWRRERHISDLTQTYARPKHPGSNTVLVEEIQNICNVDCVLYTAIGSNITTEITPALLANYAIASIMADAGLKEEDGVRYLFAAKKNGIITGFSEEYETEILTRTKTKSLKEAIQALDLKRSQHEISS